MESAPVRFMEKERETSFIKERLRGRLGHFMCTTKKLIPAKLVVFKSFGPLKL